MGQLCRTIVAVSDSYSMDVTAHKQYYTNQMLSSVASTIGGHHRLSVSVSVSSSSKAINYVQYGETANGIKLELDLLEATEKVVVIERKEFRCKNKPVEFTIGGVSAKVWTFLSETVPAKLYIPAGHVKAVATNVAAGIRAALSAPWGS